MTVLYLIAQMKQPVSPLVIDILEIQIYSPLIVHKLSLFLAKYDFIATITSSSFN